jgi:hypothetical protein
MVKVLAAGVTLVVGIALLPGCGDNKHGASDAARPPDAPGVDAPAVDAAHVDAAPPDGPPQAPMMLADTGLCADVGCTTIGPGIRAYTVRWPLWADGAGKRRWIYLPPGSQIDTSTMDWWQFPVGTKAWKEFGLGGALIETRYIERFGPGPGDFLYMAYQWNLAQDAAVAVPNGVTGANGTAHDIPNRGQCRYCHEGEPSRLLGFAALQLDVPAAPGSFVLDDLVTAGRLSAPPAGAAPHFPLPGAQGVQDALGYLHANCSHCHNPTSQVHAITPMSLHLFLGDLATPASTNAYTTAVGVAGAPVDGLTTIVVPGQPDQSIMIDRMNSTNPARHMPILGSVVVDPDGQTVLRAWITGLL